MYYNFQVPSTNSECPVPSDTHEVTSPLKHHINNINGHAPHNKSFA